MTDWPWAWMLIVACAYLAMFAAGELLHRYRRAGPEQTRKLSHVAAGMIALVLPAIFSSPGPVVFVVAGFVVLLLVTRAAGLLPSVHGIRRSSAGAFMYPVAIAATFTLAAGTYPRYAIAILALALGDAAGGILGGRWGRHGYAAWGQRKTLEGSLGVVFTVWVIASLALAIGGVAPTEALTTGLLVGLVTGLFEGALPFGLDNLGVPLAALAALDAAGSAAGTGAILVAAAASLAVALAASRFVANQDAAPAESMEVVVDAR